MPDIMNVSTDRSQSELSRRGFIVAAAGLMAGAYLPTRRAQAATPKQGGTARIGLVGASTGDSLDPATFVETERYVANWTIRNNLTEISVDGDIIGELAESWEPTADLSKWTFRLRKGIEFHNGKSLTAADVAASINHHRGKDSKSTGRTVVSDIEDITTDGPLIVMFRLNKANADFPAVLADFHLSAMPLDRSGQLDVKSGIGTGGYVLQSYEPGVRTLAVRNRNYWKTGRAHFDAVELLGINDTTARTNALRSGALDIMQRCDVKTASLLAKAPGIRVVELQSAKHYVTPMRTDTAPFDDVDVRLAIKYAINRQAIVDTALGGHGFPGNDHPLGPTYKYYAADIPQREYDLDRAKFHLKKAGHSSLKLTFHTSTVAFPTAIDAAILMKEHARPAGIDIEVVQEPADNYWSNIWGSVAWCQNNHNGRATEGTLFTQAYKAGANSNKSKWNNPRFNALLTEVLGTIDTSKRRDLYREMQMLIRDDGADMTFAFTTSMDAHSEKVLHDDKVSATFELDGCRAIERWWFA